MAMTPTPGGVSGRSMSLPVALRGEASTISRWWRLFGALLMNLALGTLYAWSVFVAPLEREFGWKRSQTSAVFTFAAVMFAAALLFGGKIQDRFGPFWISFAGSILITLSFFLFSFTSNLYLLYFFYGILGGIGTGFGYGTVVPVMAKWFPDRTGLAIGLALARIRQRIGVVWDVCESGVVSTLRLADFLRDSCRNLFCNDHDRYFPVEESKRSYAGNGTYSRFSHRDRPPPIHSGRSFTHAGVLPDVAGVRLGIDRGPDGHQPVDPLCQQPGNRQRGPRDDGACRRCFWQRHPDASCPDGCRTSWEG